MFSIIYEIFLCVGLSAAMGVFYVHTQKNPSLNAPVFKKLWVFIVFCIGLQAAAYHGARLLNTFVFTRLLDPELHTILYWRAAQNGIVFYGGLIGLSLFTLVSASLLKLNALRLLDWLVLPICLAHFWGRLGCFFRGCCFGELCDLPWAVTHATHELPAARHPVQLYEAAWIAVMIFYFAKRWPPTHTVTAGIKFARYLLLYAPARFFIEFFRADPERGFIGSLSTSQFLSILFIFIGILLDFVLRRRDKTKHEN